MERLYMVWTGMKQRCNNPNRKGYKYYGGRGITVCKEWESYKNFRDWAIMTGYDENAKPYECTLDRIDPNGNYEPLNCRWATMQEQANNTRRNHLITVNGITRTLGEWSRVTGVNQRTIQKRIERGWNEADAVLIKTGEKRELVKKPKRRKQATKPIKNDSIQNWGKCSQTEKPTETPRRQEENEMKPIKQEWFSIKELTALGYGSRSTIMQHIAIGDFGKGNPGGGKWLIKRSEYDKWLEERTERRKYKVW